MTPADEIIKVVVTRGFIQEPGKVTSPGDILAMTRKKAWGFISSGQAEFATDENIKAVKDALAVAEAQRRASTAVHLTPEVIQAVKDLLAEEAAKLSPAKTSKVA